MVLHDYLEGIEIRIMACYAHPHPHLLRPSSQVKTDGDFLSIYRHS